jgi:alpha-ribazole phosphatase
VEIAAVRHAKVALDGICYGQSDVPTIADAKTASEALIEQVSRRGCGVSRVWASPWRRTREPAALVAAHFGVPLSVDARLSELAFGQWEGRPYAELEREPAFAAWMQNWREAAPPEGERLADLIARVRAWCRDVQARNESVLAVTHAGVIRALRADARGVEYERAMAEPVAHLALECFVV